MESGIQSSFIPHDASVPQDTSRFNRSQSGLSELILLFSIVILVASGALAGAVFLYAQYAESSEASKLEQLKRAQAAFEPSLIQELTRLDDRMSAGSQILSNHIAPTALFDTLQQTTLTTVAYNTLDFTATDPQHTELKMTGVAEGVNSVALQADLMSKSGVITSPIFSDISRQADGVHFSLAALVNPAALNYMRLIGASQAAQSGAPSSQSAQQTIFGGGGNVTPQQAQQQKPVQQTGPTGTQQAGQGQLAPQLPSGDTNN